MTTTCIADIETELEDLLREFRDVAEELKPSNPRNNPDAYRHLLKKTQIHSRENEDDALSDAGFGDWDYSSEGNGSSLVNSLSTSEEELYVGGRIPAPKAKPGDTGELESFIDSLEQELSEM